MRVLNPSDMFSFSCIKCGVCCFNNRVELSTLDILNIIRALEKLNNMPISSQQLFDHKIVKIEYNSPAPVALIDFDRINKDLTACPFLEGTINNFLCTIYEYRPLICRIYPVTIKVRADGHVEFLLEEDNKCPGFSRNQMVSVYEHLKLNNALAYFNLAKGFYKFMIKVANANLSDDQRRAIAQILYNFDTIPELRIKGDIHTKFRKILDYADEALKRFSKA